MHDMNICCKEDSECQERYRSGVPIDWISLGHCLLEPMTLKHASLLQRLNLLCILRIGFPAEQASQPKRENTKSGARRRGVEKKETRR